MAEKNRENAQVIQDNLKNFVQSPTSDQKDRLRKYSDLFEIIDERGLSYLTTINNTTNFQERFKRAIDLVLQTPFATGKMVNGKMVTVNPWNGGFTLVAMDLRGRIRANSSKPVGEVYQNHNPNLYPYALTKAMQRLHLITTASTGGLEDANNYEYIKENMGGKQVYLGEIAGMVYFPLGVSTHDSVLIFGASGCELSPMYREMLAPGMLNNSSNEFAAGYADMEFAKGVMRYLRNGPGITTRPTPISEPEFFSLLRRAH